MRNRQSGEEEPLLVPTVRAAPHFTTQDSTAYQQHKILQLIRLLFYT